MSADRWGVVVGGGWMLTGEAVELVTAGECTVVVGPRASLPHPAANSGTAMTRLTNLLGLTISRYRVWHHSGGIEP